MKPEGLARKVSYLRKTLQKRELSDRDDRIIKKGTESG